MPAVSWASSAEPADACASCSGTAFDADGFCDNCGARRPAGRPHVEIDFGSVAGVGDIGKRHHNNEDAMGLAVIGDGTPEGTITIAIVCDGVSSSERADTASNAAAHAAVRTLISELPASPADQALTTAVASAQAAATLAAGPDPGLNPPSTTFVAAVISARSVTVGWVGDSRAYWLPDGLFEAVALGGNGSGGNAPARLTVDDTLAEQLTAAGVTVTDATPNAGALVRWLGADAGDTKPHTHTFTPSGPGRVIVCSDGLYRYLPEAVQLAAATPAGSAIDVAGVLVRLALDAGGQDNVTVTVMPYPPTSHPPMPDIATSSTRDPEDQT